MTAAKEFAHKLQNGLAVAGEAAGLAILGVSLAALMWAIVTPKGAMTAAVDAQDAAGAETDRIVARLSRIEDPFVRGGMAPTTTAEANGFTLHATRAAGDGAGTAIISPSGGQQGAYSVGEEISPGVSLAAVGSDHVEIDVGGRRMRVAFPGAQQGSATAMAGLPANYQAAASAANVPSLSGLPLQPVMRSGKATGFEVMPHADGGVLAAAGLKPGDILVSVNGVSAANADLATYRAQLFSGQPIEIRFERGGELLTTRLGQQ